MRSLLVGNHVLLVLLLAETQVSLLGACLVFTNSIMRVQFLAALNFNTFELHLVELMEGKSVFHLEH